MSITMVLKDKDISLSCDPANARRHQTGTDGVKCATGHVAVSNQAGHGKYATGTFKGRIPRRVGTWNVRGLNQAGKVEIVEGEMKRNHIDILGLSETHWRDSGYFSTVAGNKIYFSGPDNESSKGVAVLVPPHVDRHVIGYKPVSDRIIVLNLDATPCKINLIQVYAPTAQSSEEDIESFYNTLEKTLNEFAKKEVSIVLGDFNAKVGSTQGEEHLRRMVGKYGIGERNERGERLLQFCSEQNLTITNTLFKHHIRRLYTWNSPGDRYRNQIDFILVQNRWRSSIMNTLTYPGADCGSDHQLLVATFRIRFRSIPKPKNAPSLRHVDTQCFEKDVEMKLQNNPVKDSNDPDTAWKSLQKVILQVARENIVSKIPMKHYISTKTADVIIRRRKVKQSGLTSQENKDLYAHLSTEVQRCCRKDYDQYINNICDELERNSWKNEIKDLFRRVKVLTKSRQIKTCTIADEAGDILTEKDQVLDRWKRYCTKLYDTGEPIKNSEQPHVLPQEPDILLSEVECAIKKLKHGKSPGKDGIPAELLKKLGPKGTQQIHNICNAVWKSQRWPVAWTESIFVPLHKKGSKMNCNNYRTLALIPHVSKILLYVINQRLKHFLNTQIPQEQAGFVKDKGTREQILNIRQIIEKSREFNNPVVLCFIDYTKAFDFVQWDSLWKVLEEMGTPQHLIELVKNLYVNNRSFIKLDTDCSDVFQTKRGVRQGCILSPLLFNVYGEYIIRKTLEDWKKGFVIGGKRVSNLRYADDTVLLTTSVEDMKMLLNRLVTESGKLGLTVNKQKTKLMVVDRADKLTDAHICIPGIDRVNSFIYLGAEINSGGSSVPDIKRRIAMARDAMTRLQIIWKNRSIGHQTKTRLVRALVFPIFMYGVETWTILARERQRIDAFEMWCWRRMLRIPWTAKRTNVSILSQLRIKTRLSAICLHRILSYFGHIMRRGDESLEKLVVVGGVEGKRARGRSPTRWADQIKEVTSSGGFCQAVRAATDRNRWRQIIKSKLSGDHDPQ